jgi:carboxypeptidase T
MKIQTTLIFLFLTGLLFGQDYSRVKVFTDHEGLQKLGNLGVTIDHGTHKEGVFYISDFSAKEIEIMQSNDFKIEILIEDVQKYYREQNTIPKTPTEKNSDCDPSNTSDFVPEVPSNFNLGSMAGFYLYQEMLDELDAMAAQYPNLITVKAPISTFLTHESRPIYWVKISDNAALDETDETEVLYSAVHHAREPGSMSEVIFYMWYMLENYDTSDEIKYLLDNTELYFIPCLNPDGYIYNEVNDPNGGGMHRKNRRDVGTSNKGVDLNRNYSYGWGTTGVSMDPDNDTYPGTGAFSEPETQAMQWFCNNHDFLYAFNAHTYSNLILFPIGTTSEEFAEDHDYFDAFTAHMVQFNGYSNIKSSGLYPASGDSDDYMYKEDLVNKPKIFAMTPEVGSSSDGFWPAESNITSICQGMVFPNMVLAHLTHKYVLVEDNDATTIATITGDFNHTAYRLGYEDGIVTVSIEPLLNIQTVGSPIDYDLAIMESQAGTISYELVSTIQPGDLVKYVLKTDNGLWVRTDTITKTYGTLTMQFLDDATDMSNWTGGWSTTGSTYYSPSNSFTDSPSGNYANNTIDNYELNQTIDLTGATAAKVTFYAKWEIESDYDYCQFQVSTDNGVSWIGQCGLYTNAGISESGSVQPEGEPIYDGTQNNWVLEEIELDDYLGQTIKVRFQLRSDGGSRRDGFYFDDFKVLYNLSDDFSLEQPNKLENVKLMPNPTQTYTYLSLNEYIQNGEIFIYDCTGKVIQRMNIDEPNNHFRINTVDFEEGVYFVKVYTQQMESESLKMVVIH